METLAVKPVPLPPLPGYSADPDFTPPDHPFEMAIRRSIVDFLEFSVTCPRPACRRAGRCRDRNSICFDTRRADVAAGIAALVHDGYVDEDDEDAPF